MENESKKQTENIDNSNEKLLLSDVIGSDLVAITLHFKLTEKEYDRFKNLMKTDSGLWDKLLLQFGCATM
jgi:hypothetical protein